MKLIVGLGNPGEKYAMTRHNVGFMAIDAVAQAYSVNDYKEQCKAITYKLNIGGESCLFAKPQTFMNNSGQAVSCLMQFYKIELSDLLVVHDEVDLPFAALRFQTNRGHGGNNGIRNIHLLIGDKNYDRLKLGVSRPSNSSMDVADWVLQSFSKEEWSYMAEEYLSYCVDAIEYYIISGHNKAATKFNKAGKE